MKRILQLCVLMGAIALVTGALPAFAAEKKPNILVIWGDDIGRLQHQRLQPGHDGLQDAEH